MVPKVLAGTLWGPWCGLLVPRQTVKRWIGEGSGLTGLVIATVAGGAFSAGPSNYFRSPPGFLIAGADRGAAIAFFSAWLLLGVNRAPYLGNAVLRASARGHALPDLAADSDAGRL